MHSVRSDDESELLTIKEAARLIRLHPNTLRNWANQEKVPSVRIGPRRDRRFRRDELLKLLVTPSDLHAEDKKELTAKLNPQELISIAEAAKQSRYSAEYLSFLARRGHIDAIKIGRNWLTTRSIVEAYTNLKEHMTRQKLHRRRSAMRT